jgi:allantoin racemase
MKILILNPNTTAAVTDRIAAAAREAAAPGTEIVAVTAPRGLPYIANRAEAVLGGALVLELLAEHRPTVDAAVIAAFGDPALGGARELFDIPIVGMTEAGLLTACMLGRSFAIVTFAAGLVSWYRECVEWHGLERRCVAIRGLDGGFTALSEVQDEHRARLVALANRTAAEDGADVIVLAGAPLSGLAATVRDEIAVPVVDCAAAALKQAEALVALRPRKPELGAFRRPPAKDSTGLAAKLASWLARE